MMKKALIAAALFAAMPWGAGAQVEKRVEVTKAYVPSVESAAKLAMKPDMTDTVRMRPDIDYTITPLSLQTTLQTRPIRPATVTYWEFNRPLPFYLKVGAGYPLNSVVDFYGSSQNPGTGYVIGYVNHEGRYADIKNMIGLKNNSIRMTNRAGVAAGKYFGRRVLEGEMSYDNRLYHRYGAIYDLPENYIVSRYGPLVDFGDANLALRFGDDFQDLSRTNFEVALRGGYFFDHSDWIDTDLRKAVPGRQSMIEAYAKIARVFGRHRFSVDMGYEYMAGRQDVSVSWQQQQVRVGARYGLDGGIVRFEAGADYFHDMIRDTKAHGYLIPFARLDFDLGTEALRPFVELDGGVNDNSFRSLTRKNPYLAMPTWLDKSSIDYNGRLGLSGSLWRHSFNYRVYADVSIRDNHVYWVCDRFYSPNSGPEESLLPAIEVMQGVFTPTMGRQTVTSFHGEVDYRPLSVLRLNLGIHGYLYNDETKIRNGEPALRADLGVRYEGRKIAFGVKALFEGKRSWSVAYKELPEALVPQVQRMEAFRAEAWVDLRVDFEWKVSGRVRIFAEGRNLLNTRILIQPYYPEYGASCTAGVKLNF